MLITKKELSDMMTVILDLVFEFVVDLIAELTSSFMCPRRFVEEKYVVCQYDDVEDLIGEEDVPAFDLVPRVVECDHREGQLRDDDENASCHGDTADRVERATAI